MYWAGGCPHRVHRSGKPYPGAKRFMEPKMEPMPRDLYGIAVNVLCAVAAFVGLLCLCAVLLAAYG